MNDLDISAQYMDRLIDDLIGSESASQTFLETELSEVEEQMRDLGDLAGRMRVAAKVGYQLFAQSRLPDLANPSERPRSIIQPAHAAGVALPFGGCV